MKGRPLPIVIVSILFVIVGVAGFISHAKDLFASNQNLNETIWPLILAVIAVVCGLLLIVRISWARWLAIAWMACHVIISAFNSTSEMIAHIVFLIVISILLFLPVSTTYFRNKGKQEKLSTL